MEPGIQFLTLNIYYSTHWGGIQEFRAASTAIHRAFQEAKCKSIDYQRDHGYLSIYITELDAEEVDILLWKGP